MASSLAKLTSISTQTLSLLLERQRLPPSSVPETTYLPRIQENLAKLKEGITKVEGDNVAEAKEAIKLLKSQYGRMRSMLSVEERETVPELETKPPKPPTPERRLSSPAGGVYTPYTDNPSPIARDENEDPGIMLQEQRRVMEDQDTRLDSLSSSIGRQHHLSININDELDVHQGLLSDLDDGLDRVGSRLSTARRSLDRVSRGVKGNGSTVAIAVLILVLLVLIIVFKT